MKARAARSASDSALRANIGKNITTRSLVPGLRGPRSISAKDFDKKTGNKGSSKPKKVKSVREKPDPNIIDAEIVSETPRSAQFRPTTPAGSPRAAVTRGQRAIAGPSKKPTSGTKKPRGAKKEVTPGMRTVFKATPAVDLNEGPNFGKTTSIIEKTQQPKPPRTRKPKNNA